MAGTYAPYLLARASEARRRHVAPYVGRDGAPRVALFVTRAELRALRIAYAVARHAPRLPLPR